MPRQRNIPSKTRQEWLERHDAGARLDEIARGVGRNPRTVRDQVNRARQEREQREIRTGLLRDAYQRHFEDLLGLAEELRHRERLAALYGPWAGTERRSGMLLEALWSHIPKSELWKAYRDWDEGVRDLGDIDREANTRLAKTVDDAFPSTPSELQREGFIVSLTCAIREIAQGVDPSKRKYYIERKEAGPDILQSQRWGEFSLSHDVVNRTPATGLETEHTRLINEIGSWELVSKLSDLYRRWDETRETIEGEVEALLLRRMLPGQCYLCPGSEGTVSTKSRKRRKR